MKGETLIEVLIALSVAVVLVTAIAVVGISSLNNAQFVQSQDQSSDYAQEGMELIRNVRNRDYVGFRTYSGTYCFGEEQTILGASVPSCTTLNIRDKYVRSVIIQQDGGCGATFARATVRVAWSDGKCASGTFCHKSEATSCFSTVQPVTGP